MSMKAKRSLTITGHGGAGGGQFDHVKITGEGSVSGDVECLTLRCMGNSVFHGNLKAGEIGVTGNITVHGDIRSTAKVKLTGNAEVDGTFSFAKLETGGQLEIRGRMSGEEIKLRGYLKTDGDCEAESFNARGSFNIGGLLNAGELDVKLFGPCSAAEIGGDRITVRLAGMLEILNKWFKPAHNSVLTADIIEGDEIELENTHARVVRGNRVIIGSGCRIGLVEYKSAFKQTDPASSINEHKKI